MQNVLKTISGTLLVALVLITTAVFICPMTMRSNAMVMDATPSLCQSAVSAGLDMGSAAGCIGSHLAAVSQFLGNLPHVMDLLLAMVLFALLYYFFPRNFLIATTQSLVSRLRHYYLYYRTSVKLLVEKKILQYLGLLGNYTIVSLS